MDLNLNDFIWWIEAQCPVDHTFARRHPAANPIAMYLHYKCGVTFPHVSTAHWRSEGDEGEFALPDWAARLMLFFERDYAPGQAILPIDILRYLAELGLRELKPAEKPREFDPELCYLTIVGRASEAVAEAAKYGVRLDDIVEHEGMCTHLWRTDATTRDREGVHRWWLSLPRPSPTPRPAGYIAAIAGRF